MFNKTIAPQIVKEYRNSRHRIIFLDYDGTLVPFAKFPELAVINKYTYGLIQKISEDTKNQVVIISGRDKTFLEDQFRVLKVSLVAEHGFFIKTPGDAWVSMAKTDSVWKGLVRPVLLEYVNKCKGSFIEEKASSLSWHFRNANPENSITLQCNLRKDLSNLTLFKNDFEILEGHKVLEVKSNKFNKGMAARYLMGVNKFDFILAAGDDRTDEFLFKALPESAFTIRIGLKQTFARYDITDSSYLLDLLKSFT